jgi:UDP-hydrolysing UDP-N-acetyl-D-glucosamine 2-epimerase
MKKICFISSTRADYGLLKWSMLEVQKSKDLELQLIVTGMHLSPKFGSTYEEIEKDLIIINDKVDLGELEDSKESMSMQVAKSIDGISKALLRLSPDAVVVLGDRYEILGAAQAAFFNSIPLVHLHGGEVTEGAIDDVVRHCITKLSNYHVTSTEAYKKRVIQLGEDPKNVYNLGAPGLESFTKVQLMNQEELSKSLGFKFYSKNILVTFHPVTFLNEEINELIEGLANLNDVGQIITMPNSDPGHSKIMDALKSYAKDKPNVFLVSSLGQLRYTSLMKIVDLVVGNSSSGIIEAPFSGTRTLNIGDRQKGRLADDSVFNVSCNKDLILKKLQELLQSSYQKMPSFLYGDGNFAKSFCQMLTKLDLSIGHKKFHDL